MGFYDASTNALINFCVIKGRASRSEFWWFQLLGLAFYTSIIVSAKLLLFFTDEPVMFDVFLMVLEMTSSGIVFFNFIILHGIVILGLYLIVCGFCLQIRRLHDVNKSGWWLLISLFPYLGPILLLYWNCKRSDISANDYGPNPHRVQKA